MADDRGCGGFFGSQWIWIIIIVIIIICCCGGFGGIGGGCGGFKEC